MSKTPQQRIDDALSQLAERLVPALDGEDDAAADDRYFRALEAAKHLVNTVEPPQIVADENHVADLIKRKLVRDHDTPDQALQFGNLFARLLSRPVLNQKWAILYLLHQLSNSAPPPVQQHPSPVSRPPIPVSHAQSQQSNGIFDDTFAKRGLSTLPTHQPSQSPRVSDHARSRSFDVPRRQRYQQVDSDSKMNGDTAVAHGSAYQPSEASLLRDLPFVLQGVSSNNLVFTPSNTLQMPQTLPAPVISLLHALAEPSLLYKGLSKYLDSTDGGLVGQSLRAAVGIELRAYLGLVATLEGQIRRALATVDASPKQSLGKAGVTLRRCVIWTREATLGLRLMSLIVDESRTRKGGQLITLIHSLAATHGDPFVGAFADRLLSHVTRPFYDMLRSWIYDGELSDPYHEFFVSEHAAPGDDEGKGAATSVWEDKYKLDDVMIPTIITEEFARKVFLIGKSLNFIRYGCGDSAWVEEYSKSASRELRYGDTATLETSIDEAYKTTMARLIDLMNNKFHLLEHLTALKKYLLLGQGDFIALLMESLASNLDRPANSQYRHTLTAQLEHAIRNSNAQHDSPDVLRRLDARMLQLSMGEIGWDVFTLEYKTDAPVDVIVTPQANIQYLKVFNFLWRIKRVEFALGLTWRRCMTGARGVLAASEREHAADWKAARCAVAEMIHFVVQLQYYILFEVIEASWAALLREMAKPDATLDDLIQAHAKYLRSITRKGLLSASSSLGFTAQLHELLKTMLSYRDAVDGLYAHSVNEATKRQQRDARIESRTRQGTWGITERDDDDELDSSRAPRSRDTDSPFPPPLIPIDGANGAAQGADGGVPALRMRLTTLAADFRAKVSALLGDLAYQPDPDMRFLGVVMNFNDTYKIVRRSRRKEGERTDRRRDKTDRGKATAAQTPAPAASRDAEDGAQTQAGR